MSRLLGSLRGTVEIDAWVTKGSAELDAFVKEVDAELSKLATASGGKLVYRIAEANTEEARRAAKDAGLLEGNFSEGSVAGVAVVSRGFSGLAFRYGAGKTAIPALDPRGGVSRLPYAVVSTVRQLVAEVDRTTTRFGVVTGKSELRLSDENLVPREQARGATMESAIERAFPSYSLEPLDLKGGRAEIDGALAGIVITQPGADYTDEELRRIDDFVMRGGKALAVFAGAVNVDTSDPEMRARLDTRRLERLLDGYGVQLEREAILDWENSVAIPLKTPDSARPPGEASAAEPAMLRAPWIVHAKGSGGLDATFAGFFELEQLGFPFPSTLVAKPERQPGASVRVVARTTGKTAGDSTPAQTMKLSPDLAPRGPYASRAIAVAVEGELGSAFAPARRAPGRVLVVSSSQFLTNPFARLGAPAEPAAGAKSKNPTPDARLLAQPYAQRYIPDTIVAFKLTLDWMSTDPDLVACMLESKTR